MAITAVTVAELWRGAQMSMKVAENLAEVSAAVARFTLLPLEERAATMTDRVAARDP